MIAIVTAVRAQELDGVKWNSEYFFHVEITISDVPVASHSDTMNSIANPRLYFRDFPNVY